MPPHLQVLLTFESRDILLSCLQTTKSETARVASDAQGVLQKAIGAVASRVNTYYRVRLPDTAAGETGKAGCWLL